MTDFDANVERTNDFLAHYGVPGMKWGKRKADDGGGSSKPSAVDIKSARDRLNSSYDKSLQKLTDGANKTERQYEAARANNKAAKKEALSNATNRDERKAAKADYKAANKDAASVRDRGFEKLDREFGKAMEKQINDPDVETANRMTTGEKWMTGVGAGLYGAAIVGTVALASRK